MDLLEEYTWRILELKRMKWRLLNRPGNADPHVIPAALDWLDGQIANMKKTITG